MKWWQAPEWAKNTLMNYPDRTKGKQGRVRGEFHDDGKPVRIYVGSVPWTPRV